MKKRFLKGISYILTATMILSSASYAFAQDECITEGGSVAEAVYEVEESAQEAVSDAEESTKEAENQGNNVSADSSVSSEENVEETEKESLTEETSSTEEESLKEENDESAESSEKKTEDATEEQSAKKTEEIAENKIQLTDASEESIARPAEEPVQPTAAISGLSVVRNDGSEYGMFPVSNASYEIKGDKIQISFITPKKKVWTRLYVGYCTDENKEPYYDGVVNGKNTEFTIEVPISAANSWIPIALWRPDKTDANGNVTTAAHWYTDDYLWMSIPDLADIGGDTTPTPSPTETPSPTPTETPSPTETPAPTVTPSKLPDDGIYSTSSETGVAMFKIVDTILTVKDGEMTAKITLSGTGNVRLYMGSKENAAQNSGDWIEPCETVTLDSGKEGYVFQIPVSALDTEISLASQGKSGNWFDRKITVSSADLVKIGDVDSKDSEETPTVVPTQTPTATPTAVPTITPTNNSSEKESTYDSDTSGSTSAVNNQVALKDGVYTPDSFTFSGGTGKVSISCTKITVTNGQAYATLVFSSAKYGYVKANGNTYYPTVSGGTSIFTIPVELNKNNSIIGMTTAMSSAHEIEYKIFVYLAAAANSTVGESNSGLVSSSNKNLDEQAPEIVGLTYESETKLENAEYFKIYNYEDGIVLLEIDTSKDTANDPEKKKDIVENSSETDDTEEKEAETKSEEILDEDESEENSSYVSSEDTAKLYQENVVKYLIVPENVEVPVGLDKDMIVIQRQADEDFSAFVSSVQTLDFMDETDSLDLLSALGMTKEELKEKTDLSDKLTIKEAKSSTKNTESTDTEKSDEEKSVYLAGSQEEPDYKQIVKAKVNLAFLGSDILPKEETESSEKSDDKSTEEAEESLTVEEQEERYENIIQKLTTLGIPVIVDRSDDEKSELASYEWIKVYGAIFGKSEEAEKLYQEKVKEIQKETANETTNK